jgi:hypothetical protein
MTDTYIPASDLRLAVVSPQLAASLSFNRPSLAGSISSLEASLGIFVQLFGAPRAEFSISGDDIEDDKAVARSKLGITRQLLGTRLGAHLTRVVESLSDQRTLSVAESVRSVLETAGAAAYYAAKFRKSQDDIPTLLSQLDRATRGARFEWESWKSVVGKNSRKELEEFWAKQASKKPRPIDRNGPPSVMTFIDALESSLIDNLTEPARIQGKPAPAIGQVRTIYSQLCDFVHPSIGTWITYGEAQPEELKVIVSSGSSMNSLRYLWFGIGECVATMSLLGLRALEDMETLRRSLAGSDQREKPQ